MYIVNTTDLFENWLRKLRDSKAKGRILLHLRRLEKGNFGDHKSVGNGVFELKIDYGSGYRVYYYRQDNLVIVLLLGGDKKTQQDDIEKAKELKQCLQQKRT